MGIGDKTTSYIKKRLRQKGLLKNTSKRAIQKNPPTLQELNQSNNKGDGIIKSPYRTNKQLTGDPKHKSEFQWLHDPVKGVEWDYNPVRIRELAQSDAWVQMLVNTMTTEIANTPWQIVEEDATGETTKVSTRSSESVNRRQANQLQVRPPVKLGNLLGIRTLTRTLQI